MTDHPFEKGDKIVCIDASASYKKLTEGAVYTVFKTSRASDGRPTVELRDGVDAIFLASRFEKVAPKVVVHHTMQPNDAAIFMDAEGIKMLTPNDVRNGAFVGVEMAPPEIKPGDWVAVQGQVLDQAAEDDSPGDYLIEFFSHGERWEGWVRKDRVQPIPTPGHVEQCPAMTVNVMDTNVYYRCEKPDHRRFDRQHKSGDFEWLENDTSGYIEEA